MSFKPHKIENDQDALRQALFLAVTAPTQEKANECMEMAAHFSLCCTADEIEDAKSRVDEVLEEIRLADGSYDRAVEEIRLAFDNPHYTQALRFR